MKLRLVFLGVLTLATALVAGAASSSPKTCGPTTLEGTIVEGPDGRLVCGPGQPLSVRDELAGARSGRENGRRPLASFLVLSDFQLADEESPLRGEWADKCGDIETRSAFRPHETMVAHMMNAHVRAASRLAASGGPVAGGDYDFVVALGDLADNQQLNETRWFIDILDGGGLVDPDSGADGYDGVQSSDPAVGAPALTSPVPGQSLRALANEPFLTAGLRGREGRRLPWYSAIGNHDMKVQGTVPDDNPVWREFVRRYVVGGVKVMDVPPERQHQACEAFGDSDAFQDLLTDLSTDPAALASGTTKLVPSDARRRLLDKSAWVADHYTTTGIPVGHGFDPVSSRCPRDGYPDYAARACYSFVQGRFHYVVLDTNAAEGLSEGNIDDGQFRWLERELVRSSPRYFDAEGEEVGNPQATDRYLVIFSHHTISTTVNTGPATGAEPGTRTQMHTGEDLKRLLLRFPNVILQGSGHTHQNKIWAHESKELGTGYWEVNTSAVADYPHQSRSIEIVDNGDETLSIFAVAFDAAVHPDAREISWGGDDPTNELTAARAQARRPSLAALGEPSRRINEDWMAAAGLEAAHHDPQRVASALGTAQDRNAELLIAAPFGPRAAVRAASLPATGGGNGLMGLGTALLVAAAGLTWGLRRTPRR